MDKASKYQPVSVLARSGRMAVAPALRSAPCVVLACLLVLLTLIPQFTFATPSLPEAQNVQNLNVKFEQGLLTVEAKDVMLNALMEEISKKAGMAVSVSESLQKNESSREE